MKDLRVAFLLDMGPHNWKSQEETHFRLCRALVARGATPVLVYSGKVAEDVLSRMQSSGAEVITEARLHGTRHYYRNLKATFRKFNVNLVHVRYFVCQSMIHWLARSLSVRRIIFTEANGYMPSNRGHWNLKRVLGRSQMKLACWPVTRFIAISQFIRDRLILYGVNADRIAMVYNGIEVDRFAPDPEARIAWRRSQGIGPDEVVVSTVGRLDPIKRVDTIVHAFGELVKRGVPAQLFVAGAGPLESDLKAISAGLGLADRIHWLGHVENALPLFQASDIFTLASVGEAFGFVLAEAMACGVPCVGSRCGGIPEVVDEGRTGLLATPGDPCSFADAYERLARDGGLCRAMGQAGVDRVRRLFDVDGAVENTLAVYEDVLK